MRQLLRRLLTAGLCSLSLFATVQAAPTPQMEAFCTTPAEQANRQLGLAQAARCTIPGNDWRGHLSPYDYFLEKCHASNPQAVTTHLQGLTAQVKTCLDNKKKIAQKMSPGNAHYYRLPATKETAQYKIPGMTQPLDLARHLNLDHCVMPFLEVNQQGSSLYFKLDTEYDQYSSRQHGCLFTGGTSSTSSEFWFVQRGNGFCLTKARFADTELDLYSEGIQESQEDIYNLSLLEYSFFNNRSDMDGYNSNSDKKKMRQPGCIGVNQISISPVIPAPVFFRKKGFLQQYVIE